MKAQCHVLTRVWGLWKQDQEEGPERGHLYCEPELNRSREGRWPFIDITWKSGYFAEKIRFLPHTIHTDEFQIHLLKT